MKSLRDILETYKPNSGGESKFIKKHKIKPTPDANGNDDAVFKGSKIKIFDRSKSHHGYNPGDDEKLYEETDLDGLIQFRLVVPNG